MAKNRTRDMSSELHLGITENSYMRLAPNRGGLIEEPRAERLDWPTYQQVERHVEPEPVVKQYDEVHTRGTRTTTDRY